MVAVATKKCRCGHAELQHEMRIGVCDNCGCGNYDPTVPDGYLTVKYPPGGHIDNLYPHEFVGEGLTCERGKVNSPCARSRTHSVHTERVTPITELKDSGERLQFASGMVRDVEDDKPGFHFLVPKNIPYEKQMITRVAQHLRNGARKYAPRNWEKGDSYEEAERARESAFRHMMQWVNGETDEDHAAAIISNIIFAETMQYKANQKKEG